MEPSTSNPYQSLPDASSGRAADSSTSSTFAPPVRPLASIVGAVVDNLATIAFGIMYQLVMVFRLGDMSGLQQEVERNLQLLPHRLTLYVAGGGMSVLGGYIAGRIARRNELWHGLAAGLISVLIGKLMFPGGHAASDAADALMEALGTPLTIASAGLGGYLAISYRRRLASAG
jgi:hypothetical protein